MRFARWEKAVRCSGGPALGAVALLNWLSRQWPHGWSGGIYNCRPVRGRQSMSIHAEGRAVDFMLPVHQGKAHESGDDIVKALGARGDQLGIQAIIWNRRIWSARSPNGRPYTGVNPHIDHLHIELTRKGAATLTAAALGGTPPTSRPTVLRGSRGAHVQSVQRLLGVAADGIFGPKTEQAVRMFQQSNGLKVDGVVGRNTWAALTS